MNDKKWCSRAAAAFFLVSAVLLSSGCAASGTERSIYSASEESQEIFGELSLTDPEHVQTHAAISAAEADAAEVPEEAAVEETAAEEASGKEMSVNAEQDSSEESEASEITKPSESQQPEHIREPEPAQDTISPLEQQVNSMTDSFSGTWSVYFKRLDTGESFSVNDHAMVAASLIKLYIYGTAGEQIEAGKLSTDYYSTMRPMISDSDNDATNTMIDAVGMPAVNSFIAAQGWTQSQLNRKMLAPDPVENYTSVSECGDLLERVYNGTYVSESVSEKLLDAMLNQSRRWKIPAGLPSGTECANKTGELSDVENDVAIVYSPACTYILCIMSDDIVPETAQSNIAAISETIYNYLNP